MALNNGDPIPAATFMTMGEKGPQPITTDEIFKGKKVILVSVPGAFTPTCSNKHLPGYIQKYEEFKQKGIDTIACMAVNDAFVMDAWGKAQGAAGKILMLADGNGEFAKKIGLEMDGTKFGMGTRGKRFSAIVENGVVKELNVEAPGEFNVSSADATVCQLR
jgi:glutaredoxin/glutathione-dependent peroxiredoxin